jgi:hypothetical protein
MKMLFKPYFVRTVTSALIDDTTAIIAHFAFKRSNEKGLAVIFRCSVAAPCDGGSAQI